jgi:hypothetical protein
MQVTPLLPGGPLAELPSKIAAANGGGLPAQKSPEG